MTMFLIIQVRREYVGHRFTSTGPRNSTLTVVAEAACAGLYFGTRRETRALP
jgi:hypothetical protein